MPQSNSQSVRRLQSFKPIIDKKARIIILGTMPGPEALRKQEYYGFSGNHFWEIIFRLFNVSGPSSYAEKKKLLSENRIALWDVFKSCERKGALDSKIRAAQCNDIPGLLKRYPKIQIIFLNGRTAEKVFRKQFSEAVKIPVHYLPSTSPAHAALSFEKKLSAWSAILKALSKNKVGGTNNGHAAVEQLPSLSIRINRKGR